MVHKMKVMSIHVLMLVMMLMACVADGELDDANDNFLQPPPGAPFFLNRTELMAARL